MMMDTQTPSRSARTRDRSLQIMLAVLAVVVAGGWLMVRESSASRRVFAPPTSVAIVSFGKIVDGLDEMKANAKAMDDKVAKWKTEFLNAQSIVAQAKTELDMQTAWSIEWLETQRRIAENEGKLESLNKISGILRERDGAISMRRIYAKAMIEIEKVSKAEGYDLVLYDDRDLFVPDDETFWKNRSRSEVVASVTQRQVMYASDTVDITQRVVTAMNNAYHAGN